MIRAKPFDIPKREVWEAFKRVKANQGAAGVDGQSIQDFEARLGDNLYKLKAGREASDKHPALSRGRKLVVQMIETFGSGMAPSFVEKLDSLKLAEKLKMELAPVMIYGDDVTHVVTEEGIANLLLCRDADEREQAIRGVAGFTEVGRGRDAKKVDELRGRKVVLRPEDLGVNPLDVHRSMLAARSVKDLMTWSGGLYDPPAKFRNW